jgi:hypothetical protein
VIVPPEALPFFSTAITPLAAMHPSHSFRRVARLLPDDDKIVVGEKTNQQLNSRGWWMSLMNLRWEGPTTNAITTTVTTITSKATTAESRTTANTITTTDMKTTTDATTADTMTTTNATTADTTSADTKTTTDATTADTMTTTDATTEK